MLVLISLLACAGQKCPSDMVYVAGGSFTLGVDPPQSAWQLTGRPFNVPPFCIDQYEYPNQLGEYPKSNVSFDEAVVLCQEAGKRLCTEAEWTLTCRGKEGRLYSYGPRFEKEYCHTNASTDKQPFAPSGQHPRCQSPEGVFDLNGNVSEWVDASWPQSNPKHIDWKTLRGGTIQSDTHYGQDCTSRHGHHRQTWRNSDDGFRCCSDLN